MTYPPPPPGAAPSTPSGGYASPPAGYAATPGMPVPTGGSYQGAQTTGQIGIRRSPIAQWLMMLIPIYGAVHLCSVAEQLKRYNSRVGGSGVAAFFAFFPGVYLLLIPPIVWTVRNAGRIRECQKSAGLEPTCSTGVSLLLSIVFGLNWYYWQSEMMKIWDRYPGAVTGQQVPLYA